MLNSSCIIPVPDAIFVSLVMNLQREVVIETLLRFAWLHFSLSNFVVFAMNDYRLHTFSVTPFLRLQTEGHFAGSSRRRSAAARPVTSSSSILPLGVVWVQAKESEAVKSGDEAVKSARLSQ